MIESGLAPFSTRVPHRIINQTPQIFHPNLNPVRPQIVQLKLLVRFVTGGTDNTLCYYNILIFLIFLLKVGSTSSPIKTPSFPLRHSPLLSLSPISLLTFSL